MNQLSDILRQARAKLKLTQQEVADKIGTSQRSYGFYEDGKRNPKITTLNKIADVLSLDKAKLGKLITSELEQKVPFGISQTLNEPEPTYNRPREQDLTILIESNNKQAHAQDELATAHRELVRLLTKEIEGVSLKTGEDLEPLRLAALDFLFEVAAGTRYKSAEEARKIWCNKVAAEAQTKRKMDIDKK